MHMTSPSVKVTAVTGTELQKTERQNLFTTWGNMGKTRLNASRLHIIRYYPALPVGL